MREEKYAAPRARFPLALLAALLAFCILLGMTLLAGTGAGDSAPAAPAAPSTAKDCAPEDLVPEAEHGSAETSAVPSDVRRP